jgi:hypothetical protein
LINIKQVSWTTIVTIISGIIICVLLVKIGTVFAQWDEWRTYIPGGLQGRTLAQYIRAIIDAALVIAAVVAVIYLIVGGYQYITSSGNAETVGTAKHTVLYAIIGLVVIFAAFVIIDYVMGIINAAGTVPGGGTVPTIPTTPPGGGTRI